MTEGALELRVHSRHAVIGAMLAALWSIPVCRLAFPGEFTHRAYKSDRFDLAQVERLRDLGDADTETQQHAPAN